MEIEKKQSSDSKQGTLQTQTQNKTGYSTVETKSISDLLSKQLSHEIRNAMIYQRFAAFYRKNSLPALGEYYELRAKEEVEHHNWIYKFLCDTKAPFNYTSIEAVTNDIVDIRQPFVETIDVEKETTEMINRISKMCIDNSDFVTFQWLTAKGMLLEEQKEEESTSIEFLNMFDLSEDLLEDQYEILKAYKKIIKGECNESE